METQIKLLKGLREAGLCRLSSMIPNPFGYSEDRSCAKRNMYFRCEVTILLVKLSASFFRFTNLLLK